MAPMGRFHDRHSQGGVELVVQGLADDATWREVHVLFSGCLGYQECKIATEDEAQAAYAIVTFVDEEAAWKAAATRTGSTWPSEKESITMSLDGHPLDERIGAMECDWSRSRTPRLFSDVRVTREIALRKARDRVDAACKRRKAVEVETAIADAQASGVREEELQEAKELLRSLRHRTATHTATVDQNRARLRLQQAWPLLDRRIDIRQRYHTLRDVCKAAEEAIEKCEAATGMQSSKRDLEKLLQETSVRWKDLCVSVLHHCQDSHADDALEVALVEADYVARLVPDDSAFANVVRSAHGELRRWQAMASLQEALASRSIREVKVSLQEGRRVGVEIESMQPAIDLVVAHKRRCSSMWGMLAALLWSTRITLRTVAIAPMVLRAAEEECLSAGMCVCDGSPLSKQIAKMVAIRETKALVDQALKASDPDPALFEPVLERAAEVGFQSHEVLQQYTLRLETAADLARRKFIASRPLLKARQRRKTSVLQTLPAQMRAGALLGVGDEAMEEAGRALREAQAEQLLEDALKAWREHGDESSEDVAEQLAAAIEACEDEQLNPLLIAPAVRALELFERRGNLSRAAQDENWEELRDQVKRWRARKLPEGELAPYERLLEEHPPPEPEVGHAISIATAATRGSVRAPSRTAAPRPSGLLSPQGAATGRPQPATPLARAASAGRVAMAIGRMARATGERRTPGGRPLR